MVILEAREACSGATGRNGDHLKPEVYFNIPKYKKMFGSKMATKMATKIATFEASHVYEIKHLVEKEKINCEFTLTRVVDVCLDQAHANKSKAEFDTLLAAGEPSTRDVHYAGGKAAEMLSGVKGAKAAFSFTVGSIWPYKMVMHLLQQAVNKGANLQTLTPVLSISPTTSPDNSYTLLTPRGPLLAKTVILATNAYTSSLARQYTSKITPCRGICTRITAPPLPKPHPTSQRPTASTTVPGFTITKSLGWMGASLLVKGDMHDLAQWYSVADDGTLVEPAISHFEDGLMQKYYRGWEGSGARLDRAWTGIMGYTSDLVPHIGAVPGKSNQYICAGFNGHGMPQIFLAAKGVAKMIREGCSFGETGIPGVFETSEERLRSTGNAILDSKPQ